MKISQTLLKSVIDKEVCPKSIFYQFEQGIDTVPSKVMELGKYFEHRLLGETRGGETPEPKFIKTGLSADYKACDEAIENARTVIAELGLDLLDGEKQLRVENDLCVGHLDWLTTDILDKSKKAIYDVKYTLTAYDDRWNGWANVEEKFEAKLQAAQYIMLCKDVLGYFPRFYFLVFGKSKWVRLIKMELTQEGLEAHIGRIKYVLGEMEIMQRDGWKATPEFNKCLSCCFNTICDSVAKVPTIETVIIH